MKKDKLINVPKFIILIVVISLLVTLILSTIISNITNKKIKEAYKTNGIELSETYAKQLIEYKELEEKIINDLNEKLIKSANIILMHRNVLSNEYLKDIALIQKIHNIWWYSPDGTIIYDSSGEYVGWKSKAGDPIDKFIKSGLSFNIEGIRKSTEDDRYYMVVYIRAQDGYFVQTVLNAEYVNKLVEDYNLHNFLNKIALGNNNIEYSLIIDKGSNIISNTNNFIKEQDLNISIYNNALNGESFFFERSRAGKEILEVVTPIIINNEIIAFLDIAYAMDNMVVHNISYIIFLIVFAALCILFLIGFIETMSPFNLLVKSLNSFDSISGDYQKPKYNIRFLNNTFKSLDILSKRIKESNNETELLSDEVKNLFLNDFLTNIPNRLYLTTEIEVNINENITFAVLFLDLDDFKNYNDTLGHDFGDRLLVNVADILKKIKHENLFISRYGGDEFVILYKYHNLKEVKDLVKTLYDEFTAPLIIDDGEYPVDFSIGIAVYPRDAQTPSELLRKSDIAMYYSKRRGKNKYTYYLNSMNETIQEETSIINSLRMALRSDGFKILIQPQVDINTGQIISYEALARLKYENIGPNKFIPIAEQANLINDIGRVIIDKAVEALLALRTNNIPLKTLYVNLSANQFQDIYLLQYIKNKLEINNIEPCYFGVELTESSIVENETAAINLLNDLKRYGVKIALDDFGSGQSSFNYLIKYPIEIVKLDREYSVNYLNPEKFEIFNTVINFANLLNFKVLVEGIENEDQIELLKSTKCELVQGFYYYKPMTLEDIIDLNNK